MTLSASELERELSELVGLIDRLMPTVSPDRWHTQKSELRGKALGLIERCGFRVVPVSPRAFTSPTADSGATTTHHNGRSIPIERRRPA